jgi:hypothetical protein
LVFPGSIKESRGTMIQRCFKTGLAWLLVAGMVGLGFETTGRAGTTPFVQADADAEGYSCVLGVRSALGQRGRGIRQGGLADRINASNFGGRSEGLEPMHVGLILGGIALATLLIVAVVDDDDDDDNQTAQPTIFAEKTGLEPPESTASSAAGSTGTGAWGQSSQSSQTTTTTSGDGTTTHTVTTRTSSSSSTTNR